ncbi:MAG: DUF1877 family protein [Rubritalea sp.]|uniref:DUF1877 family protein n=1 Tax=Rubritalea sp. TaxID=2109375 RepID=UPI003241F78C
MITTFTRVATDDLDALIDDEELVLSLVNDLGFDSQRVQQLAGNAEAANPETLFHTLEGRWNGQGQVYSIEDQIGLLMHTVQRSTEDLSPLAQLAKAGRATNISNGHGAIRVLFPAQIDEINDSLTSLPVEVLQGKADLESLNADAIPPHNEWTQQELITAPLWQIYDGLCTFFQNAVDADEYILLAVHAE